MAEPPSVLNASERRRSCSTRKKYELEVMVVRYEESSQNAQSEFADDRRTYLMQRSLLSVKRLAGQRRSRSSLCRAGAWLRRQVRGFPAEKGLRLLSGMKAWFAP